MKTKRVWLIFLITTIILLAGCGETNHSDKFNNFFTKDIMTSEGDGKVLILPSGYKVETPLFFLDKEKKDYNPKIVLNAVILTNDEWLLNVDNIKKDMRYLGEIVIKYAEKEGWENDYYLYVKKSLNESLGDLVYDYETDTLYIPNRYDDYLGLYNYYKTFSVDKISETSGGVDFLVEKRIGRIVHNKFERNFDWLKSYSVHISDGVFKEYSKSDSYRH